MEDDFGDFNMDDQMISNEKNSTEKSTNNPILLQKTDKKKSKNLKITINNEFKNKLNNSSSRQKIKYKKIKDKNIIKIKDEHFKPIAKKSTQDDVKLISNSLIQNTITIPKEELKPHLILNTLDIKNIKKKEEKIIKFRSKIKKIKIDNENTKTSINQLNLNKENLENQSKMYQTKIESIINEMKFIKDTKEHYLLQRKRSLDSQKSSKEIKESIKNSIEDIAEKKNIILKTKKKLTEEINELQKVKNNFVKINQVKESNFQKSKVEYSEIQNSKDSIVDRIKKEFDSFDKLESSTLKLKDEEQDVFGDLKNEENSEKLLALEIEHLKATNLIENQKISELKQEIDKNKYFKENLFKEVTDLNEKLKYSETDHNQNNVSVNILKQELEKQLMILKEKNKQIKNNNLKEINVFTGIENDIKNKISYVSLQNNNVIEKYQSSKEGDDEVNFFQKSAQTISDDKNNEELELLKYLKNNNIRNIEELQKSIKLNSNPQKIEEENNNNLKSQLLNLIQNIPN